MFTITVKAANMALIAMLLEIHRLCLGHDLGYSATGLLMGFAIFSINRKVDLQPMSILVLAALMLDVRVGMVLHFGIHLLSSKSTTSITSKTGETRSLGVVKHSICGSEDLGRMFSRVFGEISIDVLRDNLFATYISDFDPDTTVLDEYTAIRDFEAVRNVIIQNFDIVGNVGPYALVIGVSAWLTGPIGFIAAIVWAYYTSTQSTKRNNRLISDYHTFGTVDTNISMSKGIYSINHSFFGYDNNVGIGYSDGKAFYSMHHVTRANAIEINGAPIQPSYVNPKTDTVCYGGSPRIATVHDGDDVIVALASARTNAIIPYKTKVSKDDSGLIMFRGNRSTPGTSGSPIFVKREKQIANDGEEFMAITYEFAGCAGWFYDADPNNDHVKDPKIGTEIMYENPYVLDGRPEIKDKDIMQIFDHPGSGKTWKTIPSLVASGLDKYGKVFVTGPSLVVCEEIKNSLEKHFQGRVALLTSTATTFERGSSARTIVVAAHDTMMSMITRGEHVLKHRGLWIVDEAHTVSVGTMCLIDHLRDAVVHGKAGSLVELTATGWNLQTQSYELKDGSNYPIEELIRTEDEMWDMMFEDAKHSKVLVFVERIRGSGNSMDRFEKKARSLNLQYVNVCRESFSTSFKMAKNLDKGLIFTTDISECGANYGDVYTVYDFQKSPKMIVSGNHVTIEVRPIDAAQSVQRRGRTGRVAAGRYVSPGYQLSPFDTDRVEFRDRRIYCESRGIQCLEPRIGDSGIKLSSGQAAAWIGGGESRIHSPQLVQKLFYASGRRVEEKDLKEFVKEWLNDKKVHTHINGEPIHVGFWDERDRVNFVRLYNLLNASPAALGFFNRILNNITASSKSDLSVGRSYHLHTDDNDAASLYGNTTSSSLMDGDF